MAALRSHALFTRLEQPSAQAAKAACYIYHTNGPCVDTGVQIDYEGYLTLSLGAIKELAEVAGFAVNEDALELETQNAELERQVQILTAERDELVELLDAVGTAVRHAAQ